MNVLTLLGSPRAKGNTATLAKAFNETALNSGANISTYLLNKMTIRGCQACDSCKKTLETCILKDDLTEVLNSLQTTDILVVATPIYFADITAQLKLFVDRCYSLLEPFDDMPRTSRLKPGKKMVLITSQNRTDELFAEVCDKYCRIFEFLGFEETFLVRGCDLMKEDALKTKNREDLIELARETARALFK